MAIEIGPVLKRRRDWARLTQQELVEHTRMDRSSSYISAIEKGRTSPTLEELELLARYFRLSVIELIQEAMESAELRASLRPAPEPVAEDRLDQVFRTLTESDQDLAIEFMELLARRRRGT
ncbi:MAG: helix-turn-helix transcriptional regulator [Armatimonadetes bacterium]|nr:helix-turn-helix transcriptional regulator [Armatimonadota bacterium]